MNALLFAFLLAGMIEPKPPKPAVESSAPAASARSTSVIVVADGSSSWSGAESGAIIEQLRSEIDPAWPVHVALFDAETMQETGLIVAGSNRDLVQVRPRTPMKEAIALTLDGLAVRSPISALVVVAHEQMSPTYVRTDQLIASLKRSNVPVYTIHLSGPHTRANPFRRLGRAMTAGTLWMVQALIEEDRESYSPEGTARMLKSMSDQTGGMSCVASGRKEALGCVETIATRITESFSKGGSDQPTAGNGRTPPRPDAPERP